MDFQARFEIALQMAATTVRTVRRCLDWIGFDVSFVFVCRMELTNTYYLLFIHLFLLFIDLLG
jgi:hypothetical protein